MSHVIKTLVFCDGCQDNCGGDDRWQDLKTIRSRRAKVGWEYVDGKDYCPACKSRKWNVKKGKA